MNISQNKEQLFTKGLDNIDVQILTIVKRYFENNPEDLWASVDGIITEVLRRVKLDLTSGKIVASVTSVNGKIGQVDLNAKDVFAEPIIQDKKSAFNKSFGSTTDTVCVGDDQRLSDARKPLAHEHEEYIKKEEINLYIKKFLEDNGFVLSQGSIKLIDKDFVLENGTFMEVEKNG